MRDDWFNKFLGRIDGEDCYNDYNLTEYQGLLDEEVHVKKMGWFTRLYRRVSGKELEDEFKAHQERMKDEKYRRALFEGLDDDWLMSEFKEIHGIVTEVKAVNNLIDDLHHLSPPGLKIFEGQFYLPLEGTIHEADLQYQMEHCN